MLKIVFGCEGFLDGKIAVNVVYFVCGSSLLMGEIAASLDF